jgi:uridylate kinase
MTDPPIYRRVVLKLSGESLAGKSGQGLDPETLARFAAEIRDVHALGVEMGIIVGGGNFIRGARAAASGMDRTAADQMGMLATVMNAMALRDALEEVGVPTRVLSAVLVQGVVEPYIHRRAMKHLENREVVIFAGGTGNPYFSTDTAAALRALEVQARILFKATKVDGVYDDDPMTNPRARRYETLTHMDCLNDRLRVMDATAVSLCMENGLPILVFDATRPGNIRRAALGERLGTLVGEPKP